MRIIVSGASGQLGRLTAELLLARSAPAEVILVSRHPEALADFAARGADIRRGDFDDPDSLHAAFAGGERLLLISTDAIGRRAAQQRSAIDAAVASGVRHVVYTSLSNPAAGSPVGIIATEHRETEQALRDSGLAWTILRNAQYADSQVAAGARAIATGQLVTNAGEGRTAYVARTDCAAAAAAVLSSAGHEGKVYDVTGPELLQARDLAALLAEVSGRPVALRTVDDETIVQGMVAGGLPEPVARIFAGFGTATREGYFDQLSTVVTDLTGRPARSLRELLTASRTALLQTA